MGRCPASARLRDPLAEPGRGEEQQRRRQRRPCRRRVAAGRGSGRSSPDASAIPSKRKTGIPTAGNVQIQSPDACTAKYASVPSARHAGDGVEAPRDADERAATKKPTEQREADDAGLEQDVERQRVSPRRGVSLLRASCR